jgi:hypothetical protein
MAASCLNASILLLTLWRMGIARPRLVDLVLFGFCGSRLLRAELGV